MKRGLHLLEGIAITVLALLQMTVPAFAIEYNGVGGKPANPRADNPRSGSIFIYDLKAGDTVKDAISITNGTDKARTIGVYSTDSIVSSGGAFACEQQVDADDQVGKWIKLSNDSISLESQSSGRIGFEITVPKDAEVGEHNGCIAVQDREQKADKDINGLQLSFRSAVRVAITVPGNIIKKLEISSLNGFTAKDSKKQGVKIVLHNSGNVSLDAELSIQLKNVLGNTLETIKGTYAVMAGNTTDLNFEFKRPVLPGLYSVSATATYISDTAVTLGKEGSKTSVEKSTRIFVMPSVIQFLIIVLLTAILAAIAKRWWVLVARRKRYLRKAHPYTVKLREDLQIIGDRYNIDLKQLARFNKIKKPYVVHQGQVIYVPARKQNKKQKTKNKQSVIHLTDQEG